MDHFVSGSILATSGLVLLLCNRKFENGTLAFITLLLMWPALVNCCIGLLFSLFK